MDLSETKNKAYRLLCKVRLLLENIGIDITEIDKILDKMDDEFDPTPYCSHCNAKVQKNCKCGPIAENN